MLPNFIQISEQLTILEKEYIIKRSNREKIDRKMLFEERKIIYVSTIRRRRKKI